MANHPSAEKRNRQRITRTERNRAAKSATRTQVKTARTVIEGAQDDAAKLGDAKAAAKRAEVALDKAASKGVIHPKAAARRKSRIAKALHKASQAASKG